MPKEITPRGFYRVPVRAEKTKEVRFLHVQKPPRFKVGQKVPDALIDGDVLESGDGPWRVIGIFSKASLEFIAVLNEIDGFGNSDRSFAEAAERLLTDCAK